MKRFLVFVSLVFQSVLAGELGAMDAPVELTIPAKQDVITTDTQPEAIEAYKKMVSVTNERIALAGDSMHTVIQNFVNEDIPMDVLALLFVAPELVIKEKPLQECIDYETKLQKEIFDVLNIPATRTANSDRPFIAALNTLTKKLPFLNRVADVEIYDLAELGKTRRQHTLELTRLCIFNASNLLKVVHERIENENFNAELSAVSSKLDALAAKLSGSPFDKTTDASTDTNGSIKTPEDEVISYLNTMCRLRALLRSIENPKVYAKQTEVNTDISAKVVGIYCCITDCHDGVVKFQWTGMSYA